MDQWKRNVTKRLRQSGQEYKYRKGNLKRARELNVTGDCGGTCRYQCSQKITMQRGKKCLMNSGGFQTQKSKPII